MAAMNSEDRIALEKTITDTTGISFEEFNGLDIYERLKILEEIKDFNKLHDAIAAYKELQEYQLISWGMPKSSPSLVYLENDLRKIIEAIAVWQEDKED